MAAAVALAAALTLAGAIAVFSLISLVAQHSEHLEALWWLAAFGLVTPIALLLSERLLAATTTPPGRQALNAAAPCALLALGAALFLARACGSLVALPASLLLVLVVPIALVALQPWLPALAARGDARRPAALAIGAAAVMGVLAFLPSAARDPAVVVRTAVVLTLSAGIWRLVRGRSIDPRARLALAVLVPLVLALLAWDVSFPPLPSHQDFYLGPANDIRHGRYMLVDDYSQYGVAVIYFVSAALAVLPFGYGGLVLLVGILTSITILTVYTVLRVATRSAAFACAGTFLGLMASTIATLGHSTSFPSSGFLRFGIPWLLVCALVLAYRGDRPARGTLLAAYALVGIAAVWSFETAFYTLGTFAACVVAVASLEPPRERMRHALRQLGAGGAAALLAIVALATATALGRGELPHVGGYLDFIRIYSVSGFGQLPIPDWSLGYLMAGAYAISLTAVWVIVRRGRGAPLARPSTVVPLTAATAFGALSLTYFLGRSHPNNLTHVALPFVVMLTLWTAHAWRTWTHTRNPVAAAGILVAVACAGLVVAQQLPALAAKAPDSALAALVPGGPSLVQRLGVLTSNPVVSPRARTVEALVRRNVPPAAPLLIAVEPDVATESLIRLDRSDVVPIGTPEQDGLSPMRVRHLVSEIRSAPCTTYVVTPRGRLAPSYGRPLLEALVAELRNGHRFRQVAVAPGYRLFRLSCPA